MENTCKNCIIESEKHNKLKLLTNGLENALIKSEKERIESDTKAANIICELEDKYNDLKAVADDMYKYFTLIQKFEDEELSFITKYKQLIK